MAQLPYDVVLQVVRWADRPTLAALCAVDHTIGRAAERQLYATVVLGGCGRSYDLFFHAHAGRVDGGGPCRRTTALHLDSLGPYGRLPNLPHIPRSLFPQLERLEVESSPRTLAAVLPVLITLNPTHLVFRSARELSYAFLPHLALADYNRLETVEIVNTDLHPPQETDYPPYYRFPLPVLPRVHRITWRFSRTLSDFSPRFFASYWNDLSRLFDDWTPAARAGKTLALRLELGRSDWVGWARKGLEYTARGCGVEHVQWEEAREGDDGALRTQVQGVDVAIYPPASSGCARTL